ncbi:MAG: TldD/PmbA family protein [Candidatus Hodarchaeota archaeon]
MKTDPGELNEIIEKAEKAGATYADIRFENLRTTRIRIKNNELSMFRTAIETGLGLRVLVNGAWGFTSGSTTKEVLNQTNRVVSLARITSANRKEKIEIDTLPKVRDTVDWKPKKDPLQMSTSEKVELVLEANKRARSNRPQIIQATTEYLEGLGERWFASSEGSLIKWSRSRTFFQVGLVGKEGNVIEERWKAFGGTGGLEATPFDEALLMTEREANNVVKLLSAKSAPSGSLPAVLNSDLGYTFVHEAFGHLCEGDSVLAGESVLEGKIGEKIASECVTIIDDPTQIEESGRPAYGSFPYDDEGIKAEPTILVDQGRLISFLHSRETASRLNQQTTGNGRVENYKHRPIVRMTNIYFKPGTHTQEELFEGIRDGVYLVDAFGGQTGGQGTFHLGVVMAYRIKNGELGELLRGTGISGRTLEVLRHVEATGKNMGYEIGICGKGGQSVPTGSNGPQVRVSKLMIGG